MSIRSTYWGAIALVFAGCSGSDPCGSLTEPLLVASVRVVPAQLTLRVGQTGQFRATALSRCGRPVANAAVSYSASDPTILQVSANGDVTALAPGTATVFTSSEGKGTHAPVVITVIPVATVAISPAPATIGLGHTMQFLVTLFDSAGNALAGRDVSWASSDPSVASVDSTGQVTGVSLGGPVAITAMAGTAMGSSAVTVVRPSPARLRFAVEPSDAVAGQPLAPTVEVAVLDSLDVVVPGDTSAVTLTLGTNPAGGFLGGTTTVAAVDGIASFSGLVLERAAAGYTLVATAAHVGPDSSAPFSIMPGPPAGLSFADQPTDVAAGAVIVPAVRVEVVDSFGNVVPAGSPLIDIAIGANPGGALLGGTTSVSAAQGQALFADLMLDKAGAGYTLEASTGGRPPAVSDSFDVEPGVPVALEFSVQPSNTNKDKRIRPPVEVRVVDLFGNVVPTAAATVSLSLAANPGGAVLKGLTSVSVVGGVAVFVDLKLDEKGSGYLLAADAPGLIGAVSSPFDIR